MIYLNKASSSSPGALFYLSLCSKHGKGFRPIALLSYLLKVFEKMIYRRIQWAETERCSNGHGSIAHHPLTALEQWKAFRHRSL